MKKHNFRQLLLTISVFAIVSTAGADTVIHITGSTAFRASTITAIENIMGGGNFKAAFEGPGQNYKEATYVVIQGTVPSVPSGGVVTVKCSWAGSVAGIKALVQNLDITLTPASRGWMSITNLPSTNTIVSETPASFVLDTGTFPGETLKADVTTSDSTQASTFFTTTTLAETRVAVVPFEWVANNGSPATLNNISALQAQALFSGGMPLFQFTTNPADTIAVYGMGRDFGSGERLSCLAETGVGIFGAAYHIFPTISGTAGAAGSLIRTLKLWPAQTVLGQPFAIGYSGYAGGGALADALATPGSSTAATPSGADGVLFGPGWLIGYLGRNDAARACRRTSIATNTAHRMKWNGVADWNGSIGSNGVPSFYNNSVIQNGLYTAWEYEYLSYRFNYSGNGRAVADKIANNIINETASVSGIFLNTMNVSRVIEGGIVTPL